MRPLLGLIALIIAGSCVISLSVTEKLSEFIEFANSKSLIFPNKVFITSTLVSGSCAFIILKIHKLKERIKKENNWSRWNESISFETLLSLPKEQIIKEITIDIEKKYYTQRKLYDYINPFQSFNNDVENEIKDLHNFLFISKKLEILGLQNICFLNDDIVDAYVKIQRLSYIKNLFLVWKN